MKQLIIIVTLCLLVLALGACGKKGELKPPPGHEKTN